MSSCARLGRACLLFVGLVVALAMPEDAAADALALHPHGPALRDLAAHIGYFEDVDGSLTIDAIAGGAVALGPVAGDRIDFGFSPSVFWLHLPIHNPSDEAAFRLLAFNMRFMHELQAWKVSDGKTTPILQDDWNSPFHERQVPYRHITAQFSLAPREAADLYIRYYSEGTTALPLSIETDLSFAELRGFHNAKNAAFYGFVLFMFAYSLVFMTMLRARLFFFYSLYLLAVVVYVLHMDGLTFQFLWPGQPAWNAFAALPLGLCFPLAAGLFSREFLETRTRHPIIHRVLNGVVIATLLLMVSPAVMPTSYAKQLAFPLTFLASVAFLVSGAVALRARRVGTGFYVAGWTGITIAALFSTFAHWAPGLLAVGISFEIMRLGILMDATMMALAIVARMGGMRIERDRAIAHESVLMQEMLQMHNRFIKLENRYAMARTLAEARGLKLATTGHDLRQPLASLRNAMQAFQQREPGAAPAKEHLQGTLTYLEQLVDGVMDSATRSSSSGAADTPVAEPETFALQLVLDNVLRMFTDEARDRGVSLNCVKTSLMVRADPLVVMRIIANLTSNAVKYTDGDRVLIGCRRRGTSVVVMVVDQGPGIAEAERAAVQKSHTRGTAAPDQADGHGLGLGIVSELTSAHGYPFDLWSRPGLGTAACLTLERA